ncbi:1-acyl-sn-glycerol-3-phosphate acyltransferase [Orobanche gracilis]
MLSYLPIKKLSKCWEKNAHFSSVTTEVISTGLSVGLGPSSGYIWFSVIGWSMWFSGFIFLERNWAKDEDTMKWGFEGLSDFPMPFWLALFVEGTRFTQEKLVAAQKYAASAGLPVPRNILIPRTKGFVAAVTHLRSFVPVIYNMTVAIPKNEPRPTLLRLFRGRSSTVHVHIERHLMQELPETNSGIAQWCKDVFVAKDAFLERHLATDTFGNDIRRDIGRPKITHYIFSIRIFHPSKGIGTRSVEASPPSKMSRFWTKLFTTTYVYDVFGGYNATCQHSKVYNVITYIYSKFCYTIIRAGSCAGRSGRSPRATQSDRASKHITHIPITSFNF